MKTFICLVVIAALSITEASPAKRFSGLGIAGIGSIGGIGGAAGCVVTGNKLFANGIFLRDLTSAEQQEMAQYEKDVKKYKEEVKKIMEDKREEFHSARKLKSNKVSEVAKSLKGQFPKAPEKPSFCSDIDTTQYYFDGCMVQNNKVYVGREYARDLSPSEIKQLKEFDTKMSAYQKYVSESIHQQVQSLFGGMNSDLWSLLGDPAPATTEIPSDSTTALAPVEAPEAPSFCVAIY